MTKIARILSALNCFEDELSRFSTTASTRIRNDARVACQLRFRRENSRSFFGKRLIFSLTYFPVPAFAVIL